MDGVQAPGPAAASGGAEPPALPEPVFPPLPPHLHPGAGAAPAQRKSYDIKAAIVHGESFFNTATQHGRERLHLMQDWAFTIACGAMVES